jgi:hypothetical protein
MSIQIYIDDNKHVHVSYPCDICSDWVHTEDHCGDTVSGWDEYMCGECYAKRAVQNEDKEHAMALDPHAVRGDPGWVDPTIPELSEELCTTFLEESGFKVEKVEGFELDDEVCQEKEACDVQRQIDHIEQLVMHSWLIFDEWDGHGPIAIHKEVMNPEKASCADRSSPEPEDDVTRYGPGTCADLLNSIQSTHLSIGILSLYGVINDLHTLLDQGYLNDRAHLIFKQGGA